MEDDENSKVHEKSKILDELVRQRALNAELLEQRAGQAHRLRVVKLWVISAAAVGGLTAMMTVTTTFFGVKSNRATLSESIGGLVGRKFATVDELDELKSINAKSLEDVEKAIQAISDPSSSDSVQAIELSSLKSSLNSLDERLGVLERSISDNPEKALSIPLLRKDQESMMRSIDSNKIAVATELTRIYDQQKWILGGVGTVLFAIVTSLVTAVFKMFFKARDGD